MKYLFLIPFLILHLSINSQTLKGVVLDSISKENLEYANLSFKNKNIGSYSNENGEYHLDLSKASLNDTLIASLIGYQSQKIALRNFIEEKEHTLNINLLPKSEKLDEVFIDSEKREFSSNKINLSTGKRKTVFPSSVPFGYEVATLIENSKRKKGKIIEISLKFKSSSNESLESHKTYYRLSFYQINDLGFPGELIDYENIIIKPNQNDTSYNLNLENKNIEFSVNGFFIGIETIKPDDVKITNTMYITSPSILYTHTKSKLTFKRFGSNDWFKQTRKSVFKKNQYQVPFLKFKVVYLKD